MCQASDALRQATPPAADAPPDWRAVLRSRRPPRRTDADPRVVLLGTAGGAHPKSTRAGYANALVVGDAAYLVDCGEGVQTQLSRAGLAVSARFGRERPLVRAIFVTHLHADHIMDLANLVMGSWPSQPVQLYGPAPAGLPIPGFPPDGPRRPVFPDDPTPGIRATLDHLLRAFAYNINVRLAGEGRADVTELIEVREIGVRRDGYRPDIDLGVTADASSHTAAAPPMDPVEIYPEDDHGVRVSAVLVQHAPVFPALGFRFDTPDGSVVFSGDTGRCENVVSLARDADLLVHEVIDLDRMTERLRRLPNYEEVRGHLARSHSAPEDVGDVATRAGVPRLVLSHLVPGDLEVNEREWEAQVRPHFDGDLLCGVDLDELAVSSAR